MLTNEPDSGRFSRALQGHALGASELALTEVHAALLAKERDAVLAPGDRERAWAQLLAWIDGGQISIYPLIPAVHSKARQILTACHPQVPLRTLDALHLATCDHEQDLPLTSTDARMLAAARHLGLPIFTK